MKRFGIVRLAAAIGALVLAAAACSSGGSEAATTTRPKAVGTLVGTQWSLSAGADLGVPTVGVTVTAEFGNARITGSSGCNTYSGSYRVAGSALTIGSNIAATRVTCPPGPTAVDQAYLARLPRVKSFAVRGTMLQLLGADGKALLVYDAVDAVKAIAGTWKVVNYSPAAAIQTVIAGSALDATFASGKVSGSTGCNQFSGAYTLPGASAIKIGTLTQTAKGCAAPLQTQEQQYLAALGLAVTYRVTPTTLTLLRPDGTVAVSFTKG
ncbi:MAG: protein of unknown function Meta and HslJ [Actinomycetia bacterium]|nr:protein of unknown function Meta and HslJ [Actinomycetes bacterium]